MDIRFLVAGHETTGTLFVWTLLAFAKYPEVERKCREEVNSILGSNPPTRDNLSELKYLRNTINEVLRVYSPVTLVKRKVEKDVVLGGYPIPQGSIITLSIHALHHSPKHWDEPDKFDPDRWNKDVSHLGWYLPFLEGPRFCLGNRFALIEATVMLAAIVQNFSFRISEAHPFRFTERVTLRPQPGLTLYVKVVE